MNKQTSELTQIDGILIELLAKCDGIFRPHRSMDWDGAGPTNLYFARKDFQNAGVELAGGGSEASRKEHQRFLDGLVSTGFIVRLGKGKSAGYKLPPDSEARIRSLCGLPSLINSHGFLREVIHRQRTTAEDLGDWCNELWIVGKKHYDGSEEITDAVFDLELHALPGIVCGWLTSASSVGGHTYYSPTAIGLEISKQAAPTLPADLPEYCKAAADLYFETRSSYREKLRVAKPRDSREIGPIPLPVSLSFSRKSRSKGVA